VAFADLERSIVPGFLGRSLETRADYCLKFDDGPVLIGVSLSRIPAAGTFGRDRAHHSRPGPQTHGTPDDAALVFQCFEGIELLHIHTPAGSRALVLRLEPLHRQILALLGALYETLYFSSS
jgi:hypothetical protein